MRRKQVSKRRWVARFKLGKLIPYTAILNHDLASRLRPCRALVNMDAVVKL